MCFSFSTISDVNYLAGKFQAKVAKASYEILSKKDPDALKDVVYPNTFANVLLNMPQGLAFCPMRYRLRPFDSESEVPTKYNLYNARVEGIELKKIWAPLIGKKHVAIPLVKFHEWVPTEKGKRVVQFSMPGKEIFWTAGVFDIWKNPTGGEQIISFAIVTQEPNEYIRSVGHDRCPIIISEQEVKTWLNLKDQNDALQFLKTSRQYDFTHQWEDPLFTIAQQIKSSKMNE